MRLLSVGFESFSTVSTRIVGWLMSASAHKRRSGPGQKRCVWPNPCASNSPNWGLESCVTNSPIMNGPPSSPCCRTSRVGFLGLMTVVSSTASSGSCDQEHLGVICPRCLAHTPLATTGSSAGVWGRIMDALAAAYDAAVQMIDTSIVGVHQPSHRLAPSAARMALWSSRPQGPVAAPLASRNCASHSVNRPFITNNMAHTRSSAARMSSGASCSLSGVTCWEVRMVKFSTDPLAGSL
jgi:hypothetical protein